ncbi:CapA family protein [Streptomyces sp. NPDC001941]|uniref:CapA family protein n=1 Tax=Streptomyces sp. NPDC001941 TaxID=3154659 RepID=UPI00332BB77E
MTQRTRRAAVALTAALLTATGCSAEGGPATPGQRPVERPAPSSAGGPAAAARGFTLVATGDVLPHTSVIRQAAADAGGDGHDFRPMLAGARSVVAPADIAICHMETVYGPAGGPFSGYPAFVSPPSVAAALRATGYDSCSTASNHTLDDGSAGLRRTLDALDAAGVKHAGSARTAAEARRPAWLRGGTAKVAQLAYTYGTNDIPLPKGRPWAVNLIDEGRMVADARAARRAGADVVVVSVHWGTEWQDEPDERQLALARRLTASKTAGRPDVDLILGTHAHVPQAYQKVNGSWVIYGMGDQVAGQMFNHEGQRDERGNMSSLGRFTFAPPAKRGQAWRVTRAEFVPQWFDTDSGRVRVGGAVPSRVRAHVRQVVLSRGAAAQGLRQGG